MPKKSHYKDYKFFHPAKLVRKYGNWYYCFSFKPDFKFRLIKQDRGKWNKFQIIDEIEITAEMMFQEFATLHEHAKANALRKII